MPYISFYKTALTNFSATATHAQISFFRLAQGHKGNEMICHFLFCFDSADIGPIKHSITHKKIFSASKTAEPNHIHTLRPVFFLGMSKSAPKVFVYVQIINVLRFRRKKIEYNFFMYDVNVSHSVMIKWQWKFTSAHVHVHVHDQDHIHHTQTQIQFKFYLQNVKLD